MKPIHHRVIIVGGGIAGLAAAWTLRQRDVLTLEANDWIGGRLRSVRRNAYWVNLGAHLLGSARSTLTNLARELGVEFVVPQGSLVTIALNGRVVRGGRIELLPFLLPLSLAARLSLIRVGLRLKLAQFHAQRALANVQMLGLEDEPPYLDLFPVNERLDKIPFRQVLGPMHSEVEALMRIIANRITGELDTLSGHHGAMYALEAAGGHPRPVPVGGMGVISERLHAGLGARAQTHSRVRRVEQSATCVHLEVDVDGALQTMTADYCIVAVPAPVVREIVPDLPEEKKNALKRVKYAPWVVAGLFTNETGPMPWDDLYAVAVPHGSFSFFFNPGNALRHTSQRIPGGSLVLYTAGDRAGDLFALDDVEIRERYLNDLYQIFPAANGIVDEVLIQRWPFGGPIVGPDRGNIQQQLVAPYGRLYFAGDYLMCSGVDIAAWSGIVAARAIEAHQQHPGA